MAIQKPGKKNQEEKTAAMPVLQNKKFFIPPSPKKNEPGTFDKTTVVDALALEPILKAKEEEHRNQERQQQTIVLKDSDIPKNRLRKERQKDKTSSLFWIIFSIIIFLFAIFMALSNIKVF